MLSEKQNVPKKKFKVPHTFVIIIGIVFIASILTWILPAGEFARVENAHGSRYGVSTGVLAGCSWSIFIYC